MLPSLRTELELDLAMPARAPEGAAGSLARGVSRLLHHMGYGALTEFRLSSGRRADVFGVDRRGRIAIVEIKLSLADLRGDDKWPDYLNHCDEFYFAIPQQLPQAEVPPATGLIVADRFGAAVLREPTRRTLGTTLRNKEIRRFGLYAANRLRRYEDPEI